MSRNPAPIDYLLEQVDLLWAEVRRQNERIKELESENRIPAISEEPRPADLPVE